MGKSWFLIVNLILTVAILHNAIAEESVDVISDFAGEDETELVFNYHPDTHIALGKGVNRLRPLRNYIRCIEYKDEYVSRMDEGTSSTLETKVIYNRQQLRDSFNFSTNLSAQFAFLKKKPKAGLGATIGDNYNFSKDSMLLMVKAVIDYGRYELREPYLLPRYQKLIDTGKYRKFYKVCGTDYVTMEQRQVMVTALIKIKNLTNTKKNELSVSAEAGATFGPISASAKAKFNQILTSSSSEQDVSIDVFTSGVQGLMKVTLEANMTLESVEKYVNSLVTQVNETARPRAIRYFTSPMANIEFALPPITNTVDQAYVAKMYNEFERMNMTIEKLESLLKDVGPYLDNTNSIYFQDMLKAYNQRKKRLVEVSKHYLKKLEKGEVPEQIERVEWSRQDIEFLGHIEVSCTTQTPCGKKAPFFTFFSKEQPWSADILLKGSLSNAKLMESINLYQRGANGQTVKIWSASSQTISQAISGPNNNLEVKVLTVTRDRPSAYHKFMGATTHYVILVLHNKTRLNRSLGESTRAGQHQNVYGP